MILAAVIGNSTTLIGAVEGETIFFEERLSTIRTRSPLEYSVLLRQILELHDVDRNDLTGGIITSVVPPITAFLKEAMEHFVNGPIYVVGPGVKTGLNIKIDDPSQLGSNIVVNAVAVLDKYPCPAIIIDMATATTLSAINAKGFFVGTVILPGMRVSMNSLSDSASQLPQISFERPKHVIGRNTIESMKSGACYGTAAMLDGMLDRMSEELGGSPAYIATGPALPDILSLCSHEIIYDKTLAMRGLSLIYDNQKKH